MLISFLPLTPFHLHILPYFNKKIFAHFCRVYWTEGSRNNTSWYFWVACTVKTCQIIRECLDNNLCGNGITTDQEISNLSMLQFFSLKQLRRHKKQLFDGILRNTTHKTALYCFYFQVKNEKLTFQTALGIPQFQNSYMFQNTYWYSQLFLLDSFICHSHIPDGNHHLKGTLMQIWKSPHIFKFILKPYPKNFAPLIVRILELFTRKVCILLKKFANF